MTSRRLAPSLCLLAVTAAGCDTLRARSLANDGVKLYKGGELSKAAAKFEEAERYDDHIPTLHLNLGFTYLSLFTMSPKSKEGFEAGGKALRELQRYVELKPDDPRGRNYLVQTFADTNRYDDAVTYFKPEVDRNPPSLEAVRTLGLIASKTGRIEAALQWYQRRTELSPNDPDAFYNVGVLIWDYLHNHVEVTGDARVAIADRGIAALKRAIELRPNAPEAYTYTNLVYRERATGELLPPPPPAPPPAAGTPPPPAGAPSPPPPPEAPRLPDEAKKAADLAEADKYMKKSMELLKAQGGAKPAAATGAK